MVGAKYIKTNHLEPFDSERLCQYAFLELYIIMYNAIENPSFRKLCHLAEKAAEGFRK